MAKLIKLRYTNTIIFTSYMPAHQLDSKLPAPKNQIDIYLLFTVITVISHSSVAIKNTLD